MLYNLSMTQALDVWCDLDDAFHGKHSYGGDVAEIYAYRVMSVGRSKEAIIAGEKAFAELLRLFEQRRGCFVSIHAGGDEWLPADEWLSAEPGCFKYRCHVRVTPRGKKT